jgi:hypothetical protein
MKRTTRRLITAAAITGLLSGVAVHRGYARDDSNQTPAPGKEAPAKKRPQVSDCAGKNDCKGIGGCKTDEHGCKFKNSCKGKGGCSISEKDIQNWEKSQKEAKS